MVPLGPVIVLATGYYPTSTGTSINIASVIAIAIIFMNRDLSLPMYLRGHGVFGPCHAGGYERDTTLMFAGRAD